MIGTVVRLIVKVNYKNIRCVAKVDEIEMMYEQIEELIKVKKPRIN